MVEDFGAVCRKGFSSLNGYAWIGYPLWEILPQPGPNTIEVSLRSRPAQLGGPIALAEAELLVDFVQQRNRRPFDQWC